MGSKGRVPPHHLRRLPPGPGIGHHNSIPPERHHQHGGFPPFDMMPPHPEIMEQKLAAQHAEMQKLATENQRLAATHGTLRHDLAAIQHELQMLHNHIGAVKSDREHQIMGLLDKIGKMEADLQGAEPIKLELHQARTEAQNLLSAREELVSRVQQLTEEHQRVHMDLQQVPALMSELDMLRQEYQHCRATYEYEKKVYNDHLESLQLMEKNYMTMASEVEKLRAELKKQAEIDRRTAGADGNTQSAPVRAGYDAYRGQGYDVQRGGPGAPPPAYDPQRVHGAPPPYDPQRVPPYDPQRGPGGPYGYDPHRGGAAGPFDAYRGPGGPGYDTRRGPHGYEVHRGTGFESSPKGHSGPQGQEVGNVSYGSVAATGHGGSGFQGGQPPVPPAADGNHPVRR